MKKVIVIAALLVIATACKKDENYHCYRCTFGVSNGNPPPAPVDYCGTDDITQHQFTDSEGNPLSFHCVEKK
jgi:hypothetical protein